MLSAMPEVNLLKKGRNIEKYGICKEYREVADTRIYGFQKRDIKAPVGAD